MSTPTVERPAPRVPASIPEQTRSNGLQHSAPTELLTADGKTLRQEATDSARALGIALLASAFTLFSILTVIVILIAR